MIKLNEVTWYSKFLACIFFLCIFPMWSFYIGTTYQQLIDAVDALEKSTIVTNTQTQTMHLPTSTSEESMDVLLEQVAVGETKNINGVELTLISILQDSRCPIDVQCIRAGDVTAQVQLKNNLKNVDAQISSDEPYIFDQYLIKIQSVNPSKNSQVQIKTEDYRLVFSVIKTTN